MQKNIAQIRVHKRRPIQILLATRRGAPTTVRGRVRCAVAISTQQQMKSFAPSGVESKNLFKSAVGVAHKPMKHLT